MLRQGLCFTRMLALESAQAGLGLRGESRGLNRASQPAITSITVKCNSQLGVEVGIGVILGIGLSTFVIG